MCLSAVVTLPLTGRDAQTTLHVPQPGFPLHYAILELFDGESNPVLYLIPLYVLVHRHHSPTVDGISAQIIGDEVRLQIKRDDGIVDVIDLPEEMISLYISHGVSYLYN